MHSQPEGIDLNRDTEKLILNILWFLLKSHSQRNVQEQTFVMYENEIQYVLEDIEENKIAANNFKRKYIGTPK